MNNLRNRVQLIGNLGADPEIKQFEGSKVLAKISLATSELYTNKDGEKIKETTWHNLIAWGKTAENAEKILQKGNEIAIDGKLTNHSYEDKDGVKKYITEIVVNEFLKLGPKN